MYGISNILQLQPRIAPYSKNVFRIACNNSNSVGNAAFLNGNIAHTSFWNTDLSEAQVLEIYNNGSPGDLNNHSSVANLVAWDREERSSFDGTNWILKDVIGGYDGTSANMELTDIQPDFPVVL